MDLDLYATGNYFVPSHRVRLEVSTSNLPGGAATQILVGNFDEIETSRV